MATKEKKIVISSSNISGLEKLYQIYIDQPGKQAEGYDDFIQFMSIDSYERAIFLELYCSSSIIDTGVTIVLKVDPK